MKYWIKLVRTCRPCKSTSAQASDSKAISYPRTGLNNRRETTKRQHIDSHQYRGQWMKRHSHPFPYPNTVLRLVPTQILREPVAEGKISKRKIHVHKRKGEKMGKRQIKGRGHRLRASVRTSTAENLKQKYRCPIVAMSSQ